MSQVFCYFLEGYCPLVSCCPLAMLNLDLSFILSHLGNNGPEYWFIAVFVLPLENTLVTGLLPLVVWGIGALPLLQSGNLLEKDCVVHRQENVQQRKIET